MIEIDGFTAWCMRVTALGDDDGSEHYARLRSGTSQGRAQTFASDIPVTGRDPADLASELAAEIAAFHGSDPVFVEILERGASKIVRTFRVEPETAPTATTDTGSEALSVALRVIERMARHATESKDLAEHRLGEAVSRREALLNALWLERMERQELELSGNAELDPVQAAFAESIAPHLGPVAGLLTAKLVGGRKLLTDRKATENQATDSSSSSGENATEKESRAVALDLVNGLRGLADADPSLLKDPELVEAMTPIVLRSMGLGDGDEEPSTAE